MNPVAQWNAELQQCRVDAELKRQAERRLNGLDVDIAEQRRILEACSRAFEREEREFDRIAASSFQQFWLGLIGKLDERLDREEKEAAEAKLKLDAAQAALDRMEEQRREIAAAIAGYAGVETRLDELMKAKETWMRDHDGAAREELELLSVEISAIRAELAEIEEARSAGEAARSSLASAEDRLGSAQGWGAYDMVGGGMISTMIKHGRIDEARDHIHEAQHHLRRFAKELKDLQMTSDAAGPQIGGFLHFADYFFDGFISDWMVQGRIRDSLESVRSNADQIGDVLAELARRRRTLEKKKAELGGRYERRVEAYGS